MASELKVFGKTIPRHPAAGPVMYQGFCGPLCVTVAQQASGAWSCFASLKNGKQTVSFPFSTGYKSKEAARDALARKVRGLAAKLKEAMQDGE